MEKKFHNIPFNSSKLNFIFLFFVVFVIFLCMAFIMFTYELFIYGKYQDLYKNQTLKVLAYEAKRIFSSDRDLQRKTMEMNEVSSEFLKDPHIADLWITDDEFRLLYSADKAVLNQYHFQKLSSFYFPLYAKDFIFDPVKGYSAVKKRGMDPAHVFIVQPVSTGDKGSYDMTVGIKIKKTSFLMSRNVVVLFNRIRINYSMVLLLMILLLLTVFVSILSVFLLYTLNRRYESNLEVLSTELQDLSSAGDIASARLPEVKTQHFDTVIKSINSLLDKSVEQKNTEKEQRIEKETTRTAQTIMKRLNNSLFPEQLPSVSGLDIGSRYGDASLRLEHIIQVKELNSFQSVFLLTSIYTTDENLKLLTYNRLYNIFSRFELKDNPADLLKSVNQAVPDRNVMTLPVIAGQFSHTENQLKIIAAGFNSFQIYNKKMDEFVQHSDTGFPAGKRNDDDFEMKLFRQTYRLESGDTILFFNPELISGETTLADLQAGIKASDGFSAEDALLQIQSKVGSGGPSPFFFLVRKK